MLNYNEQPGEKLAKRGAAHLSNAELLACVVSPSSLMIADHLLSRYTINEMATSTIEELCGTPGIGRARARQLLAALELGRRSIAVTDKRMSISHPRDVFGLLQHEVAGATQEKLYVLSLNARYEVVSIDNVYIGAANMSPVRMTEVFRQPVRHNAVAVIVAHSHPSGNPEPSPEDIDVTRSMKSTADLLNIEFLDHVIMGSGSFVSLSDRGFV